MYNQRPIAVVPPTLHPSISIVVPSTLVDLSGSVLVSSSSVVDQSSLAADSLVEKSIDESNVANTDNNTIVETDEKGHSYTSNGSLNMEPGSEYESEDTFVKDVYWSGNISSSSFEHTGTNIVKTDEDSNFCTADGSPSNMEPTSEYDSEDTSVKVMDCPSSMQSRSFEDNSINVTPLQERDNTSFEEFSFSSFVSFSSARQETVQETEDVRTCSRNYNYSQDQKSKYEKKKEAVVGIQMLCPTDTQHLDIHLAQSNDIQSSQESGHSPHSIRVYTSQEGKTASHQHQMFIKLDHDINCSSTCDLPDSVITSMTVAKLVQKVDHLESVIDRLSKLVLFPERSNSRIPGSMKEQDLVISKCQENCKSYLNDGDTICHIKDDMFQITSLPASNVIHPEYWENVGHCSSACVCQADNTLESESLQYNKVRQVSPPAGCYILADEMNSISSASIGQGKAKKRKKMPKVPKDSKRGEPVNQPITMSMVERQMWDTGAESDEIGNISSLNIHPSEENLQHNMDLKPNLEGQAKMSSLVAELDQNKSSGGATNGSISEEIDAETHTPDSLQVKDSEEKDMNHNEDKSRCLSEANLTPSVIIAHTNKTPMENTENDAQLEITSNSTTRECASSVDSSGYSEKYYTDTGVVPRMDSKPIFSNSDPDVSCGIELVEDQVWNKLNLERDETAVSTSKLNLEAADSCSDTDSMDESCLNQKENVLLLSSCNLKVKEPDYYPNADASHASDASCLHQVGCNSNVTPVKVYSSPFSPEMEPEHIPGHGKPAQHEENQKRQASVGYSCDHCLQLHDKSNKEFTGENHCIQDSDPKKPRANKFISGCKVQQGNLKETRSILNKKKSLRRSISDIRCRFFLSQMRRGGKTRKVKLKKNTKPTERVRHAENLPGILSNLKILLHSLASSFAHDTVQSGALTQTKIMRKGKPDFATEKENGSQEGLTDDFLKSLVSTWFIFPTIRNGLQTVVLLPTGLQLYFERLLRGTPPEERERMSYEWLRLQTFINYPSSAPVSGVRLARAGFYYSGNGMVTVCYACGAQHSVWSFHDDPYEIHRRISSDCPFLRGNPTYPNVPIMQEREQNGIPMGNNISDTHLSQTVNHTMVNPPSNSNRASEMSPPTVFQSQNSTITQVGEQSSAVTSLNIQNPQERGLEQQNPQQTMSGVEHSFGNVVPSSINPASSAYVSENPSVIDQPVTLTAAEVPNTTGESQQGQSPTTAATLQPTDSEENTQYRSPGNLGLIEIPGVDATSQMMSEQSRYPAYAQLPSRVNSYTGWPAHLDQTPEQMAEAGFFYAGIMDYTCCFHCGNGLRTWEPGDNPWIEHARWYPQCAYVLGKRGQKFVNAVLKKQAELFATERNNTNTTTASATSTSSIAISRSCRLSALVSATPSGHPRYFQDPNENEIANRLINEMGYQRERVREVKRRRGKFDTICKDTDKVKCKLWNIKLVYKGRTSDKEITLNSNSYSQGQQEIAVEHVRELLLADEERMTRDGRQNEAATVEELIQESGQLTLHDYSNLPPVMSPPTAHRTRTTQLSQSCDPLNQVAGDRSSGQQQNGQKRAQTNQTSASGMGSLVLPSQLNMSDVEWLRGDYLRLRNQNLCKICMDRNVELAFLPCGHVMCCEVCGQTLRFCPICRAEIQTSLRIYLS